MTTGILAGLWDLLPCTNTEKYICKHLAEGAVLTVPPPTQSPPKCAEGWSQVGTRHYCSKVQKPTRLNMIGKYYNNRLKSISDEAEEVSRHCRAHQTLQLCVWHSHQTAEMVIYLYNIYIYSTKMKEVEMCKAKKVWMLGNTALISICLQPAESQFL